jgi:hypothetical protein
MALCPGTLITTSRGLAPIESLTAVPFEIWTGQQYVPARVRGAGVQPVARLALANGLCVLVSPDQPLAVVPSESALGAPLWREQQAIKAGDRVLVGYRREDTALNGSTFFEGLDFRGWAPTRALLEDPGIWHMLGYALGGGYFPDQTLRKESFRVFAHNLFDEPLLDTFEATCERYEIPVMRTEAEHAMLSIWDRGFQQWLRELGFRSSAEVQTIPNRFFQGPAWIREALLAGLFAGASRWDTTYNAPVLYLHPPELRQSALRCLWSVGIAAHEKQGDWTVHKIRVSDVGSYTAQIGSLREEPPREHERAPGHEDRWDVLPVSTSQSIVRACMVSPAFAELSGLDRRCITRIETQSTALRRPNALNWLSKLGLEIPNALHYHHAKVDAVDAEPIARALMYAVEVDDDPHIFLANHLALGDSRTVL